MCSHETTSAASKKDLAAPRLNREDFFCTICGFNALSELHLQLHIESIHGDLDY
ncbi:hypothetical protein EV175_003866, partial [Coemansia sp. RSA 1933]